MKAAVAGGLLVVAVLAATIAIVVARERDPVPSALRACVDDAGARRVPGSDSLGPLRVDLLAGSLRADRELVLRNDYHATFLHPSDGSYLAVAVTRGPSDGPRTIRSVAREPDTLPLVAFAQGANAPALRDCVMAQR